MCWLCTVLNTNQFNFMAGIVLKWACEKNRECFDKTEFVLYRCMCPNTGDKRDIGRWTKKTISASKNKMIIGQSKYFTHRIFSGLVSVSENIVKTIEPFCEHDSLQNYATNNIFCGMVQKKTEFHWLVDLYEAKRIC